MVDKQQIEDRLLAIRSDVQAEGADFQILGIDEDGVVTLKIKGSKKNKPRTRETLRRLLDYVLRQDPPLQGYSRIEMVVWETPRAKGFAAWFKNLW